MILALLLLAAPNCATCHQAETQGQLATPMAQTLQRPAESRLLAAKPEWRFAGGGYTYTISRRGGGVEYTVRGSGGQAAAVLAWAAGFGATGQTFLFEHNGAWYESAVSFYPAIAGLDWTPGHATRTRRTLDEALGRRLDNNEARRCFGCHSTGTRWTSGGKLEDLQPGVECSQCHDGSTAHAVAMLTGKPREGPLARLRGLGAEDLSAVCSKCHPSWAEVAESGPRGVGNVRHQIYRLTGSRCYDAGDSRIACNSCHDPHRH